MSSRVSTETPVKVMSNFDHVVTQWMSPWKVDGSSAWISSHVQVFSRSTSPSTRNVHVSVASLGVTSAVSTGQLLPVSYWPGGRRSARSGWARPVNPRVIFMRPFWPVPAPSERWNRTSGTIYRRGRTVMAEVVIVEAVRTPVGRRNGGLSSMHSIDLLGAVQTEVLARAGVDPVEVGQVVGGCVGQVGMQSMNVTRNAWLAAGLP